MRNKLRDDCYIILYQKGHVSLTCCVHIVYVYGELICAGLMVMQLSKKYVVLITLNINYKLYIAQPMFLNNVKVKQLL